MKLYYDALATTSSPTREFFEKISGEKAPPTDGEYITNFGLLPYHDGKFWANGNKFPTVVEWWLTPYNL